MDLGNDCSFSGLDDGFLGLGNILLALIFWAIKGGRLESHLRKGGGNEPTGIQPR